MATAALALQKANADLGSLSAYSDQAPLVPKAYRDVALSDLRSDITVWNSLTALAETSSPPDEQKAFDAMVSRWAELGGAMSSFESSRTVLLEASKKMGTQEKRTYETQTADFQLLLRKQSLATFGLGVSLTGLLGIACLIFWPKAKPKP